MKTHFAKTRRNAFGGETTSSLCGRLNAASVDGMNITGEAAEVTCAFCKRHRLYPPNAKAA